eukprot:g10753.t1
MAGRGSRRFLPSRYQARDSEVMCFNAKGDWVPAAEPLHRDVDLRKQHKCGVGPALVCARALLDLRKASSPSSPKAPLSPIGLVPCAIGGASLDEWQKHYQGVVGDCEASTGPRKQGNRPWRYKPGSKNLFGAMAARTKEALEAAPEGSRLGGMLWYQGETDGAKEGLAQTYYERFEALVQDIRGLGYPGLKIFTVAVTGSNGRLSFLPQVRDAQLRAGSSAGMSGVWVADALGLPMHRDGLHLLTNAQVELGERMALQVYASTEASESRKEGSQTAICGWERDLAERDLRVSRAEKDLHKIASMAKSKLEIKHDAVPSGESCGDREVTFDSFSRLLVFLDPTPEDRILVLGCGAGSCVVASALLYDVGQIRAVASFQAGLDETRALLSEYSERYTAANGTTRGDPPQEKGEEGAGSRGTPPSNIEVVEGDLAEAHWADASLVYAASRDFDDAVMLGTARSCLALRDGARVVTLDKPLPSVFSEGEDTGAKEEFQVAWQCQNSTPPPTPTARQAHHAQRRVAIVTGMDEKADDSDQACELETHANAAGFVAEDMTDPTDHYAQRESDAPAEMSAASMSMVQDIDVSDTGAAGMSADFDSMWGSPADFDDMSGLFGDGGEISAAYTLPDSEVTTMEMAISSGAPDEVTGLLALLESMNKASTTRELTGCYGGKRGSPPRADENGLFRMTVPLLHAAFTGSTAMFSTVLRAMRTKLRAQQVKRALTSRDGHSRTILTMALASKNKGVFEAALTAVEDSLEMDEVRELITAADANGQNIFHWAASGGCKDTFMAVLGALGRRLTHEEVKNLVSASTAASADDIFSESRTVLNSAASSGSEEVFEVVLTELERIWPARRVTRMMIYEDIGFQENILHSAIKSESVDTFNSVLASLTRRLTNEEARDFILRADEGKTVLHAAAEGGNMFEAVMAALRHAFGPEKVQKMLGATAKHGKTILQFAAGSGGKENFEAVLAAVKEAFNAEKVKSMMMWSSRNKAGNILRSAATSGSGDTFEAVLAAVELELPPAEVEAMLMSTGEDGKTLLSLAIRSGSKGAFAAVLAALSSEEVNKAVTASSTPEELLIAAAKSGNIELWQAVNTEVHGRTTSGEKEKLEHLVPVLRTAASQGSVRMWEAVVNDILEPGQVRDLVLGTSDLARAILKGAVRSRDPAIVRTVTAFVRGTPPAEEVPLDFGEFIGSGFSDWTTVVLGESHVGTGEGGGALDWAIGVLSCLLHYSTVFDVADLIKLSRKQSAEWLNTCFLETVAWSDNPFVPGMSLSIAFAKSAGKAPEGERRKLLSLQERVDALLLEVLERLPQTVQGFDGGMTGCSAVLEPEFSGENAGEFPGPLRMALQERQHIQTFCTQPLIMDFLSRRFTHGIPSVTDATGILGDRNELMDLARGGPGERMSGQQYLALSEEERKKEDGKLLDRCLLLDLKDRVGQEGKLLGAHKIIDTLLSPCILLQGANCDGLWSTTAALTVLPGGQFIVAGLAAMPDQYYRVPAMRMVLDLAVYLGMLAVFSTAVLFHEDGPLTYGEVAFAFYLLAGAITEGREMGRDFSLYVADHWNILDLLGLGLVTGGLVVRCANGDNPWGRALYALSAPLVFSRLLFFAQMLRFHGPMIQVVFSMTAELAKFATVIIVVMLGFAMSFHTLFRDVDTFGGTCLTLFKAMLGEVGFFEEFPGENFDAVATALLIIYLVVIAVMLLNLLIAVLSTSHSKVEGKADQEFKWFKLRPWQWLWGRRQAPFMASWKPKNVNDLLAGTGGGLVAGDLQMYLEDPISDPEVRQDERSRTTTVEHIKQLRDHLEKMNKAHTGSKMTQVEQLERSTLRLDARLAGVEKELMSVKAHLEERLIQVENKLTGIQQKVDEKLNKLLSLVEKSLDCGTS